MGKSYKWSRSYPVDPQIVGEIVEKLPERSADQLLRAASRKTSPIHSLFEWDNTKAAREFRLIQARLIINSLEVEVITHDREPQYIKAYIKQASDSSQYVEIEEASDSDLSSAEAECNRAAARFEKRFADLEMAKGVIAEMKAMRLSAARKRKRRRNAA